MKTKLKTLFLVIGYILLAEAIQLMVLIGLSVGKLFYIYKTEGLFSIELITKYMWASIPYMLIIYSILTIFLFYRMYHGKGKKLFKEILLKPRPSRYSIIAIGIGLSAWCIIFSAINIIYNARMFKEIFETFNNETEKVVDGPILLILLAVGIIAPICEEVIFRGVVYQTLDKTFSTAGAIVIQAVLFGIFHMNPVQIVYGTLFGIVLGYVVYRTQSLWTAIIIHMVNNIIVVFIDKLLGEMITWPGLVSISIIGLVGMLLCIRLLIKRTTVPVEDVLENNLTTEV